MSNKKQTICELEKQIYECKLKEIRAWKQNAWIVEVNNEFVFKNRHGVYDTCNLPSPPEFDHVELHHIKKIIPGDSKIYTVREWYRKKLEQLTNILLPMIGGANAN